MGFGKPLKLCKVYRFVVEGLEPIRGMVAMTWEGSHLVLTRAMSGEAGASTLYEEIMQLVGVGNSIHVTLYEEDGTTIFRRWSLSWVFARDRGFLFMDATVDEVAYEAVCLMNAELRVV